MAFVPLAFQAFKVALWFLFCTGLVVIVGGSVLLGLVISSGLALLVLGQRSITWTPVAPSAPPTATPPSTDRSDELH